MIKNGISGAESCVEVFEPYYGRPFTLGTMERLEEAITANSGIKELGDALADYYRMSDRAGAQVAFDRAPDEVKNLDLCMRDAAKALISQAGGNPDDYNVPPMSAMLASEQF